MANIQYTAKDTLRQRPFPYSTIYEHPPIPFAGAFDPKTAHIRPELPQEIATCCKNESNCTIFLRDGTWFTVWSQGSWEHAPDERIVYATSTDLGKTWSAPQPIVFSSTQERVAYGAPLLIPESQRIYLFFHAGAQGKWEEAAYDSGNFYFVFSDDQGRTWSERRVVPMPPRDIDLFTGKVQGWLNHPPQILPGGRVVLPYSAYNRDSSYRRAPWGHPAEVGVIRLDNILTEKNPDKLAFTVFPAGPRGIRVDALQHLDNKSVQQLVSFCDVLPQDVAYNAQELTIVSLKDGRWLGVVRTYLGCVGYTVSEDQGETWTTVEPLCFRPGGPRIKHPHTMCPIAQTSDGRLILLFTNTDGSERGAKHVYDGFGRTRNPQYFAVGREVPGEKRNGGVIFGEPRLLVEVDDSKEANLKTGISMPQFFEREGRFFIAYNINKEHLLLDEIPADVLQKMTPA